MARRQVTGEVLPAGYLDTTQYSSAAGSMV